MKLGTVIGRVTLSRGVDALTGGRFLVVSPFSRKQYAAGLNAAPAMGEEPSLVVYDALGGGVGEVIGYEEGREAAQPFDQPTPIDAINCALIDEMFYRPFVPQNL
jgi:ethanolamine utilization protein EutN